MKIINEAKRIKLKDNLDQTIIRIVDVFFEVVKSRKVKRKTLIGNVKIRIEDGSEGNVKVYIDPKISKEFGYDVYAYMDTEKGSLDPKKLYISIDPNLNKNKKSLYNTLYHEFLHATDPVFTTKHSEKLMKTYDPDVDEQYWGHQIEFRTIPNEILNALVKEFTSRKESLEDPKQLRLLVQSNHNILNHFANGEPLTNLSKTIFASMFSDESTRKIIDNIIKSYPGTSFSLPETEENLEYLDKYLVNLKKFAGKKWNKFLSMLYSTHDEIMGILSNK